MMIRKLMKYMIYDIMYESRHCSCYIYIYIYIYMYTHTPYCYVKFKYTRTCSPASVHVGRWFGGLPASFSSELLNNRVGDPFLPRFLLVENLEFPHPQKTKFFFGRNFQPSKFGTSLKKNWKKFQSSKFGTHIRTSKKIIRHNPESPMFPSITPL